MFSNHIPKASKGIESLILPIEPCTEVKKGREGSSQGQSQCLGSLRKAEECPNSAAGVDDTKRAFYCPFAFLTYTEKKRNKLSGQILIGERQNCDWRWLGTAKPAAAENLG